MKKLSSKKQQTSNKKIKTSTPQTPTTSHNDILQAMFNPHQLTRNNIDNLQKTIGNQGVAQFITTTQKQEQDKKSTDIQPVTQNKAIESTQESKDAQNTQTESIQMKSEENTELEQVQEPTLQLKYDNIGTLHSLPAPQTHPIQRQGEGLPNKLRSNMESMSGTDLSDVKVHYNSPKPEKVGALAYTQGADIHVGPGQKKHLAHEAWHSVQQKTQTVRPTTQYNGTAINDSPKLEKEADRMGQKAMQMKAPVTD